jgi:hypothetical protein
MLVGRPPFMSDNPEHLFALIIEANIYFPEYLSMEAINFISSLLSKNPYKRLGLNGAKEVKNHPFLRSIDFDSILNKTMKPPFLPKLNSKQDTKYVNSEFLDMTPKDSFKDEDKLNSLEDPFYNDFSYNNCSKSNSINNNLNNSIHFESNSMSKYSNKESSPFSSKNKIFNNSFIDKNDNNQDEKLPINTMYQPEFVKKEEKYIQNKQNYCEINFENQSNSSKSETFGSTLNVNLNTYFSDQKDPENTNNNICVNNTKIPIIQLNNNKPNNINSFKIIKKDITFTSSFGSETLNSTNEMNEVHSD